MREEDGARYLSPLVRQDLAKLDTDGDTRRLAVQSLKLFVEQLDASTLPRFISQVLFLPSCVHMPESLRNALYVFLSLPKNHSSTIESGF